MSNWKTEAAERKAKIESILSEMGLTAEAKFIPHSKSRNAGEKNPMLNWIVTLKRNGRDILTTDYSAGMGHCPGYGSEPPAQWHRRAKDWQDSVCAEECETGYPQKYWGRMGGFKRKPDSTPIMPDPVDVMYSLVMDSSVLDYSEYEDWAAEYGYDPDSRKGESVYRECLKLALKLRSGIGESGMETLQDAFQDY